MNSAFWRYLLILALLYIVWIDFFTSGGVINQLVFNFALFYPIGYLAGYRRHFEDLHTAYLAALSFNLLSYLIIYIGGIPIESWTIIPIDFASLLFFLKAGMIVGQRVQIKK